MTNSHSISRVALYMLMAACIMSSMLPQSLYLSVALISMIVILVSHGNLHFPRIWFIWCSVYIVAIGVNSIYSEFPNVSATFFRNTFTHIIIASVFVLSVSSREVFMKVIRAFMYIGVVSVLAVMFKERSTLLYSPLGTDTFGGGNIPFTYILIPASASCVFLIIEEKRKWYYAVFVFLFIAALLSTSRKAIFLPILYFIIYAFSHFKKSFVKTIGYILVGGILLSIVFVVFIRNSDLSGSALGRLSSLLSFILEGEGDESMAIREALIRNGIAYISERPVFGYGMGTYSDVTGSVVYSHNNYIETLFGGGLVMLIIYYSIYLVCIFRLWKRTDSVSHFLLTMCIVYMISDYGTVSYFVYPQLFMLVIAASVSEKPLMNSTNKFLR